MKLRLRVIGKAPPWIETGVAEYLKRIPDMSVERIPDKPPKTRTSRLFTGAAKSALKVVLDKSGVALSSEQLAKHYERWCMSGSDVCFLIGDDIGFAVADLQQADFVWSLSNLTFPHALARLIVCEQIYRAISISRGHAYHRG